MPIIRCQDQPGQTLQEFFTDTDVLEIKKAGEAMLKLIAQLNRIFKQTVIYGLTSLNRLVLLSKNTYTSPWYVIFASDGVKYYVDYKRTNEETIELSISKSLKTDNIEEAVKLVLFAMRRSEGWLGNEELL